MLDNEKCVFNLAAEIEATKKEVARLRQLLDQKANIAGANASSRMVNQKDAGLMEQMPTPGFTQSGPGKMSFSNSEKGKKENQLINI